MHQKMYFLQSLIVKYNVVMPNIKSMKQQINQSLDSDDYLEA